MPPSYLPALAYGALTRCYDPVVRWTTREREFKARLLAQAGIGDGHRVLDVGCGTGTLAITIKQRVPQADLIGLDADPAILTQAERKAVTAGVHIDWVRGYSTALPFGDGTIDRVVSSLFFHHLTTGQKTATFRELFRVLKPHGEFHLADWGRPANPPMRMAFLSVQLLDGFVTTRDNARGRLPALIGEAGFNAVNETGHLFTPCGTMSLFRATRP
jgi:ubiquinone/menaquinone biosynthesis C-methylase UbiE